jgi:hypothetical protein
MNNPGINLEIWKQLRQKWSDLDANGHKVKVDFKLIADPNNEENILAIDVIQHIDGKPFTETVQRNAGEGYAPLGIANLSQKALVEVYKGMMSQLRSQSKLSDVDVIVTMLSTSSTSGELREHLEAPDAPVQSSVLVNYQHYYVLNALREKMIEQVGRGWSKVKAVYHSGNLEFYFEY